MNEQAALRLRSFGIWCGIAYVVAIIGGWGLIARFVVSPMSPMTPVDEVVRFYRENVLGIRIGMVIVMAAALLVIFFTASVTHALIEVEGRVGYLAVVGVLGGAGLMVLTFYPATFWLVGAYRLDRAPELIYLMNDLSWLQFIGGVTMFLGLPIGCAIAAFVDTRDRPVFPRWFGYYNAWAVVLIIPDQLLFFFQAGPFAWNGIFGLWIPAAAVGDPTPPEPVPLAVLVRGIWRAMSTTHGRSLLPSRRRS